MTTVELSSRGWLGASVAVADTFRERLIGIRSKNAVGGILLRSKSIHTFGLDRAINVFALDHNGIVIASETVKPNRVVFFRRASRIVELPVEVAAPELNARVMVS